MVERLRGRNGFERHGIPEGAAVKARG